jgi:peptidyl-prolyl cis-trans isomerase SurA
MSAYIQACLPKWGDVMSAIFEGDPRMKSMLRKKLLAPIAVAACCAWAVQAQTVGDNGAVPTTNLNLPANLATFGKVEPTVRKATAIVNGEIITGTDVDQRLALIVIANGGNISAEEKERLRLQVLRNLIDETLQIQEAKANKIEITRDEIGQSFARVSQNFKRTPDVMATYLRQQGSSDRSIRRQIEGEVAWSRLLRRKVEPQVTVSEQEVNSVMERLNAAKGTSEYKVSEIYLSATPENSDEVLANGRKIIEQIRGGGSFVAYARQFSEASTAAVGGDLDWIRAAQLPDALAQAVQEINPGQIAGPIAIPGGYSILYLADKRQVLVADPRDALLALRQMSVNFPAGTSVEAAKAKASEFGQAAQSMGGCGKVDAVAAKFGAEVVDNDQVRVRDLPGALQEMLLKLQIGEATPPFGSQSDGVRVLVLCGRDEPTTADGPSFDKIMAQLEEERVNRRAQRYLRDLRRDAVIDYR